MLPSRSIVLAVASLLVTRCGADESPTSIQTVGEDGSGSAGGTDAVNQGIGGNSAAGSNAVGVSGKGGEGDSMDGAAVRPGPVDASLEAPVSGAACDPSSARGHAVDPTAGLVIPVGDVVGGTGVPNNAKSNTRGGYKSNLDDISQFKYPASHGNQWGSTALVNDHVYWDTEGLQYTHAPPPDPGAGQALLWPEPGEWVSYDVNVATPDTFRVMIRFSSGWGPMAPVVVHVTIDGVSSGPVTLKPDDPKIWADTYYQTGGWWGHTMTNSTTPAAWPLAAGCHLVKFYLDSFPAQGVTGTPSGHGDVWIHYFKIVKGSAQN